MAKVFTQTLGIDYMETFVLVAKLNAIRVLMSLAADLDWPLHQLYIKNAFLNGNIIEGVYISPPPRYEKRLGPKLYQLRKSLYGLKQSPKALFEKFTKFVRKQENVRSTAERTMLIKHSRN